MKKDGARIAALLPGKAVLIVITVTAVTAGFALGYSVGKSASSSGPSILKQSASSDLASAPQTPNPSSKLKNEAISSPPSQMQPSPPKGTLTSAPPSLHGATPLTADVRNEEKISPKSQRILLTEERAIPVAQEQSIPPTGVSNPDKGAGNASGSLGMGKSTPTQSSDSSNKRLLYTVQAAAFTHQGDADALRQLLEDKGYKVSVKKEPNPKGVVLLKVRVGEFEQKKDASIFAMQLKKTDRLNAFVVVKN